MVECGPVAAKAPPFRANQNVSDMCIFGRRIQSPPLRVQSKGNITVSTACKDDDDRVDEMRNLREGAEKTSRS